MTADLNIPIASETPNGGSLQRLVRPERVTVGQIVMLTATVIKADDHYPLLMVHDHVSGHNVCYVRPHIGGLLVGPNDAAERPGANTQTKGKHDE